MKPTVLVISYFFPPFNRVGGRRWAKHVKYMNRLGVNTFVLSGEFPNSSSSWEEDIKEYEPNITRVKLDKQKIPFFKTKLATSTFEKVKWKSSLYLWRIRRLFLTGNYNDISISSSYDFLKEAVKLIEEKKIKLVIFSVGPFRFSNIIILLKEKFPTVKFAIDYRDKREDGYMGLTTRQIAFEDKQQRDVLNVVDLALSVNENITKHLKSINVNLPVYTLPHCVDDDYYKLSVDTITISTNGTKKFIYGGELYTGMVREIETFVNFFEAYRTKSPIKSEAFFYLTYPAYQDLLNNAEIHIKPLLPKVAFQKELIESDFILLFRPEWSSEAFSSKFFEILCMRKPILYFGVKGPVSEFIVENNLGFHIENENLHGTLNAIFDNNSSRAIPNLEFDLSKFTFEYHTRLLIDKVLP